jgi:hypothetical protein
MVKHNVMNVVVVVKCNVMIVMVMVMFLVVKVCNGDDWIVMNVTKLF